MTAARSARYGATVAYAGTTAATTTFTVQRPLPGRLAGGSCAKPSRANRRHRSCTRYVAVGSFARADTAGANRFRFTGRLLGRKLRPGRYRMQAIPRNGAGRGAAVFATFSVKR